MIKTLKVRLLPNNKQATKLFQFAGAARFAYNWALAREEELYKQGEKFRNHGELRKEFTQLKKLPEYEWLNHISNDVTKQAIKDACNAYMSFFKGIVRHPKFKSRKRSKPKFFQDNVKIKFTDTHVKFERISESCKRNRQKLNWIKLAEVGRIPTDSKYTNPRVSYDGLNWWLAVGIEYEEPNKSPTNKGIGIDVGVKDLAICSDGNTYKNINKSNKLKKLMKKKRRLQRSVSRKYEINKKGKCYCKTRNIIKSEIRLLKVSREMTNIRQNYLHQVTSEIIKREPSFICIEDLNVGGMMKNRHLAKAVQEQCLRKFRTQIEYKSAWNNIKVIIADRWFPSSKTCSCCGNVNHGLKLKDRTFICPECNFTIDRDFQAAINLAKYGLQQINSIA